MAHATTVTRVSEHQCLVCVSNLQFAWSLSTPLLLDIPTLRIQRGEKIFLHGPSGSGKSTLLELLAGIATPRAGCIEIAGHDLTVMSRGQRDRFRAHNIGYIFQLFNLVPYLSVLENVILPSRFSSQRRQRAEQTYGSVQCGARTLLAALDLSDESLLERKATALSIGQQQRVAAARAVLGAPPLLIADEPTSALDEDARVRFLDLLFAQCRALDLTLVFVSHDQRLRVLFDRHIALADINRASSIEVGSS